MSETIRNTVNEVLRTNPKARDDDFLLTMLVYVRMGFAKRNPLGVMIYFKNIENRPALESIRRIRQEIQNYEKRYEASDDIKMKRWRHEIRMHDYYASKPSPKSRADTMANSWMSGF